ncbi:hypothetical protein G6F31_018427 [Rhizopus arrhizus]|nr:hypothetical protein G6F31_018427 [Rhizopus arrhizus]
MLGTFGTVGVVAPGSPYRTLPELLVLASAVGTVQAARRHQHHRRGLQEHHADHHRPAGQTDQLRLRGLPDRDGPDRRQGTDPHRRHGCTAARGLAQCADHGDLLPGFRRGRLAGPVGPRAHAAGHRGEDERLHAGGSQG